MRNTTIVVGIMALLASLGVAYHQCGEASAPTIVGSGETGPVADSPDLVRGESVRQPVSPSGRSDTLITVVTPDAEPIPSAVILMAPISEAPTKPCAAPLGRTNSAGRFTLREDRCRALAGAQLTATAPGCLPENFQVEGARHRIVVTLSLGRSIEVEVVDRTGVPVVDALVRVSPGAIAHARPSAEDRDYPGIRKETVTQSGRTDADGVVVLTGLPNQKMNVEVSKWGFAWREGEPVIENLDSTHIVLDKLFAVVGSLKGDTFKHYWAKNPLLRDATPYLHAGVAEAQFQLRRRFPECLTLVGVEPLDGRMPRHIDILMLCDKKGLLECELRIRPLVEFVRPDVIDLSNRPDDTRLSELNLMFKNPDGTPAPLERDDISVLLVEPQSDVGVNTLGKRISEISSRKRVLAYVPKRMTVIAGKYRVVSLLPFVNSALPTNNEFTILPGQKLQKTMTLKRALVRASVFCTDQYGVPQNRGVVTVTSPDGTYENRGYTGRWEGSMIVPVGPLKIFAIAGTCKPRTIKTAIAPNPKDEPVKIHVQLDRN